MAGWVDFGILGLGDGELHPADAASIGDVDVLNGVGVGLGWGTELDEPDRPQGAEEDDGSDGDADEQDPHDGQSSRSMMVALAVPPPSQIACSP